MRLRVRTIPLRKKMQAREDEKIKKSYTEILENLGLEAGGDIRGRCFDVSKFIEVCKFLRRYRVCIKYGKGIRYFITIYFKKYEKVHDVLTLFFDEDGRHIETEYLHTLGTIHRIEKKEDIKNYEKSIEKIFSGLLGEAIELDIE